METFLKLAAGALTRDPILAALIAAWLSMALWGVAVVALSYWSRTRERVTSRRGTQHSPLPDATPNEDVASHY